MCALLFLLHDAVTTLKIAGDVFGSTFWLWHLNVYGAIMTRLLFDPTEIERFWCSTIKITRKN